MAFPQVDRDRLTQHVATEYDTDPAKRLAYGASGMKKIVDQCLGGLEPPGATISGLLAGLSGAEQTTHEKMIRLIKQLYPGVDETVSGLVSYRGFKFRTDGVKLLARAQEAIAQVRDLSKWCDTYVSGMAAHSIGAPSADVAWTTEKYKLWFDLSMNSRRVQKVKTLFQKLDTAINQQAFEIICDADPSLPTGVCGSEPGWFGFVYKHDGRNRFYLSKLFFDGLAAEISGTCSFVSAAKGQTYSATRDMVFTALNAATVTMLHELTHITAISGTNDEPPDPYDEGTCLKNAKDAPDIACNNAENYSLFAKAVLMRRRFPAPSGVMKR